MGFKKNLVGEVRVSYITDRLIPKIKIQSSADAAESLRKAMREDEIEYIESFMMLLLNRSNFTLGYCHISRGGISGTVADIRVIFQHALKANACGMIICHNHPSGNLHASEEDRRLTRNVVEAGKLMQIPVLDHIILTADRYYSFADDGKL